MSDQIDRQAAIDTLEKTKVKDPFDRYEKQNIGLDWGIEAIKSLSSAQPEVTRCKHCKNWDRNTLRHESNDFHEWDEAECLMLAERDSYHEINRYMAADDFCSYAERRADERMGNSTDSIGDREDKS